MTGAKLGAVVTSALVVVYLVLLAERGIVLLADPQPIAKALGALILVLPAVALWGIIQELIFGLRIEKLANRVMDEGSWPRFDFELRPSGRPTRESADRVFEEYRERAQRDEANWQSWFDLGLAYDAAGDRRRAREAMRRALRLSR